MAVEPHGPAPSGPVRFGLPWLVLVVLAIPLFSMRLAFTDAGNDPASLTTRQAYDLIPPGSDPGSTARWCWPPNCPAGRDRAVLTVFDRRLADVPGVARVRRRPTTAPATPR